MRDGIAQKGVNDVRVARENDRNHRGAVAEIPVPLAYIGRKSRGYKRLVGKTNRDAYATGRREGKVGYRFRIHCHLLAHRMDTTVRVHNRKGDRVGAERGIGMLRGLKVRGAAVAEVPGIGYDGWGIGCRGIGKGGDAVFASRGVGEIGHGQSVDRDGDRIGPHTTVGAHDVQDHLEGACRGERMVGVLKRGGVVGSRKRVPEIPVPCLDAAAAVGLRQIGKVDDLAKACRIGVAEVGDRRRNAVHRLGDRVGTPVRGDDDQLHHMRGGVAGKGIGDVRRGWVIDRLAGRAVTEVPGPFVDEA